MYCFSVLLTSIIIGIRAKIFRKTCLLAYIITNYLYLIFEYDRWYVIIRCNIRYKMLGNVKKKHKKKKQKEKKKKREKKREREKKKETLKCDIMLKRKSIFSIQKISHNDDDESNRFFLKGKIV